MYNVYIEGIYILVCTVPNVVETLQNTASDLMEKQNNSTNKSASVSSTIVFVFVIALSTYHLLLLSVMRFYAIKFPLRYKQLKKATGVKIVIAAWALSLLVALLPGKLFFNIIKLRVACNICIDLFPYE